MAEAFTSYSVDNDRKFRAALKRAQETVTDLRVPFSLILADFYKSEQAIFKLKSEGKYPKLSQAYSDQKEKKVGFIYPLLVRTGRLAASLLAKDAPGSIASISATQLIVGTSVDYGIYHQSDLPRHKIPLRKFLFIGPEAPSFASDEQKGRPERWMNILNDYVLKAIRRSGAVQA